jgi:hypothetical protein
VKEVRDWIVNRHEPSPLPGWLEALHDPLASPCWLVRALRAIVQAHVPAMIDVKTHLGPRGSVGSDLICDHDALLRNGGSKPG